MKAAFSCIQVGVTNEENVEPKILWTQNRFLTEIPSILFYQDRLYSIANGGIVVCRNKDTSEIIHDEPAKSPFQKTAIQYIVTQIFNLHFMLVSR